MTYEEIRDLCIVHGISVDCWSPLELSINESVATGVLAEMIIAQLKKDTEYFEKCY